MHTSELPQKLQDAITEFAAWANQYMQSEQTRNAVRRPLYHYTDGRGLKGILESQCVWITDFRHLNDPTELVHGIDEAKSVMRSVGKSGDGRIRFFLEVLTDLFQIGNFENTFRFLIASFSEEDDDLGQWRAYADNGCGYALGLAPGLFDVVEGPTPEPQDIGFVGRVLYSRSKISARHREAIGKAASIVLQVANANPDLFSDKVVGYQFLRDMATEVIASPLIWNCLTSKHAAYKHEREVRMINIGERHRLDPHVKTRHRGSEFVPYMNHKMPLLMPGSIAEIVVGPAAPVDAEGGVQAMLNSIGAAASIKIRRSAIPYRGV